MNLPIGILAAALGAASVLAVPVTDTQRDVAELIRLENAWAAAYLAGDVKALDAIEADTWVCTTARGEVLGKAEDLAEVASGAFKATVFEMSDLRVQVYGDTAVVTGRQTEKATYKGEDASATYRVTDVWIRRNGRWRAIASHLCEEKSAAVTPSAWVPECPPPPGVRVVKTEPPWRR